MITYQVESFKECLEELIVLFDICYKEIETDIEVITFNPDYDAYIELEELGFLKLITVRSDSKLVGYFVAIIYPMLHSKHLKGAHNDTLFILKEFRKGFVGYKLLRFTEGVLKRLGVDVLTISMKQNQPFDSLCEKIGMKYIEKHYLKHLGD